MRKKNEIDKENLNDLIHLSKNLVKIFYVVTIIVICMGVLFLLEKFGLLSALKGVLKVMSPLFIGFIIAWLFHPLHKKMTDKGLNRILSAIIILFGFVGIAILFIYIFIPVLYKQVNDFISYVPSVLSSISDFITKTVSKINIAGVDSNTIKDGIMNSFQGFIINFTSNIPSNLIGFFKGLFSAFGIIAISLVVGIYMLIDFDSVVVKFHKLFPKKNRKEFIKLFENISINAHKVVNGTLLVALMVFACDTLGFLILGLNSAILFGFFCGLTDLIPYIGPYIGSAAAVIVGFTQGPIVGIGVLVIVCIVQLLESYIFQPVVMSKAMNLHPVIIIIGLLLFGYFFGIIGMVIATPCMSIIKEIILFIMRKKPIWGNNGK